jgi:hypothetical protein
MIRPPVELVVLLERECLDVDKAIAHRRWDACESSWATQRLLTHELDISLREANLPSEQYQSVKKRIDRLTRYREGQLKRLRAFSEACAERLATMGRFRAFSKNVDKQRHSALLDVTS